MNFEEMLVWLRLKKIRRCEYNRFPAPDSRGVVLDLKSDYKCVAVIEAVDTDNGFVIDTLRMVPITFYDAVKCMFKNVLYCHRSNSVRVRGSEKFTIDDVDKLIDASEVE